jgi:HK97 family phage major capsid protein
MKFKTIQDAFNHYRTATLDEIEKRAAEIKGTIDTDPNADVTSLNIEIEGLKQAKQNIVETNASGKAAADSGSESRAAKVISSGSFETRTASFEATKGDVLASPEYRSAFYKRLQGKELDPVERAAMDRAAAERRTDAFSTSTDAAAVIPTTTLNEIVSKARKQGGVLSLARAFNVPTKVAVPVATPASAASWHTEGTAVDADKPTLATVTFDPNEIIKVFSISAKVRKMSVQAFEAYLTDELTACVMECIANGLVNGTGVDQGTGILPGITWDTSNSLTFANAGSVAYTDILSLMAKLKRGYSKGAAFAMNNATLLSQVYGLVDANKRPIYVIDPQADQSGKILGYPVAVDDYLPDDTIVFGNFGYLGYDLPDGIAIESSTESSFRSGKIDYRALAIADTKPIVDEAFVKLSRADK